MNPESSYDMKRILRCMQPGERMGVRGKGRVQARFFLGKLGMFRWRYALNKKKLNLHVDE